MRRLFLFAAVLAVFGVRHLSWISDQTAEWINLAAPFAVAASAAAVLVQLEARFLPPAVLALGAWALMRPRPLLRTCAAAFGLALLLLIVWVAWHGGVPEFSDLGWI